MAETQYALTDTNGFVTNVIVADAKFMAAIGKQIADPDVDTSPDLEFSKAYDVTGLGVGIGHKRAGTKWIAPTPVPPTAAQIAAQKAAAAADAQRALDDEFLAEVATKLDAGQPLTQDERDRKDVIMARRS